MRGGTPLPDPLLPAAPGSAGGTGAAGGLLQAQHSRQLQDECQELQRLGMSAGISI